MTLKLVAPVGRERDSICMIAVPKLEHHEIPNIRAVIAAALFVMHLEQVLERLPLEISPLKRSWF
jgi:hypothetical protein